MAHSHNQHLTDQTPVDTNGPNSHGPYCACHACSLRRVYLMNPTSNGYPTTGQSFSWASSHANPSGGIFMEHPTEHEAALPTTSFLNPNNPPTQNAPDFLGAVPASHVRIHTSPYRGNVDVPYDGRHTDHLDIEEPPSEESLQHFLQCDWKGCRNQFFTFPDNGSLKQHIETEHVSPQSVANQHSSKGVWKCSLDDCTGTMTTRGSLIRHVAEQHIDRGAYQCHLCSKLFNRENNLKIHLTGWHRVETWPPCCMGAHSQT